MIRMSVVWALVAALACSPSSSAQNADEVKRLKDQIELLQAKLEAATLKMEKLEKELAVAREGRKGADDKGKPFYIMKTAGGKTGGEREVKFVVDKLTRQSQTFTFDITATVLKGELRGPIEFGFYIGTDQDGVRHEGRVNVGRGKGMFGVNISPTIAVPAKFSMPVTFPESVKAFKKLQFCAISLKNPVPVIEFDNLTLPAE